jgi:hypothetical protein
MPTACASTSVTSSRCQIILVPVSRGSVLLCGRGQSARG